MIKDLAERDDCFQWRRLIVLAIVALLWLPASIGGAAELSSPKDIDRDLTIDSVQSDGGRVSGVIHNRSAQSVSDVRLLIQEMYLWPNEFQPMGESPSRAIVRLIAGPIAPGDLVRFSEVVPAPEVGPGSFEAHVQILGYLYSETRSEVHP